MPAKVVCPFCSQHLKPRKPPTDGHRVLCPRCGKSFRYHHEEANGQEAARPPSRGTAREVLQKETASASALETETSPRLPIVPAPVPARSASPAGSEAAKPAEAPANHRLVAIAILGALGLTMLLTFILVIYLAGHRTRSNDSKTQAGAASESQGNDSVRGENDPSSLSSELGAGNTAPEDPWLPPEGQKEVEIAIKRGVAFLQQLQHPSGSWGTADQHKVGLSAMPALVLLECGVPADDIRIKRAVEFIHREAPSLTWTYDLALSILFLDRLGREEDRPLIRTLAMRLVAGQSACGGWTYTCPIVSEPEARKLEDTLALMRPRSSLDFLAEIPRRPDDPSYTASLNGGSLDKELRTPSNPGSPRPPAGTAMELDDPRQKPLTLPELEKRVADPEGYRRARASLPEPLRRTPALQPVPATKAMPVWEQTDNSNTQFAILGLWVAGRQNMPLERPLALIAKRFRTSQSAQGGWSYNYTRNNPGVTPTMTCAGLLGLAVGHGLSATTPRDDTARLIADPAIEKGFLALAPHIGTTNGWRAPDGPKATEPVNMYLMWSLERAGVLFNRRQIENKNWYAWGSELLVKHQKDDGSWLTNNYPGSTPIADTCFALLFLKRANLAKDLTKKLELVFEGKKIE